MASTFLIAGEHRVDGEPDFQRALAEARLNQTRPLCLCRPEGIETCVVAVGGGLFLRRLPHTGTEHADSCPFARTWRSSHSPRTRVLADGRDFATFRAESQALGALLRSLWHCAGLTLWQPSFEGKRSWATVRRHLRRASAGYDWRGGALGDCLYIPETFRLEEKDTIEARRDAQWTGIAQRQAPRDLAVLIGEVKKIDYAAHGSAFIIKHVPDRPFLVLTDMRHTWINRVCGGVATFCGMHDELHLVAIATFALSRKLEPALCSVHLMPTTAQWLPIQNGRERATLAGLVRNRRSFVVEESLFSPGHAWERLRRDATDSSAVAAS